jgi:Lon protease-like protein
VKRGSRRGGGEPADDAIALFPLNTVLFPKASLPLRIFEPRYKDMVERCLATGSPFGVCLIQEGPEVGGVALPNVLGTLAEIKKADHKANGDIHITVEGKQRFRMVEEVKRSPIWLARVETLEEPLGDQATAAEARNELRASMSRYANLYYLLTSKQLFFEKHFRDPVRLSYYLADLLEVENGEKQALLEAPDAATRLELELELMPVQNERLEQFWGDHKFSRN